MADLVTLAEVKAYIGIADEDKHDDLLDELIETVESLLELETDQTFTSTTAVTDEAHDGSGKDVLYLDRTPTALTAAVKVGQDSSDPDSTIPTTDIVVDQANNRIIYKDGRVFRRGRRNIFVSYTATENLPRLAKDAVRQAVAFIYRSRGREHIRGASLNELGTIDQFGVMLDRLPIWQKAVAHYRRALV